MAAAVVKSAAQPVGEIMQPVWFSTLPAERATIYPFRSP